jgi:hypothetical protein
MSLTSSAARILRIGDEFSETNQKLIQSVYEFIEWLHKILNAVNPPFECGLTLLSLNDRQIQVEYYWRNPQASKDFIKFTTHDDSPDLTKIVLFCKYLTQGYGTRLVEWMEEVMEERKDLILSLTARPLQEEQIAALKYLIFRAKNGNCDLSKRILTLLIDKSERLTKDVCISLVDNREGYSGEEIENAAVGIDNMLSSLGTTHLDQILHAMNSAFSFRFHYGDYDSSRQDDPFNNDGQFPGWPKDKVQAEGLVLEGMPTRYTFWLSRVPYSRVAEAITISREELDQVDITKSGLYPTLDL